MSFGGDSSTSPSTGPGIPADMGISKGGFTPVATPSRPAVEVAGELHELRPAAVGPREPDGEMRRLRPRHREPHHLRARG